jgi:gluconate 5-dehydrogenase
MKYNSIESLFSLRGKTAIITGATGYLGRTFSEALLLGGAAVILIGRGEKLIDLSETLKSKYGDSSVDAVIVDFYQTDHYIFSLEEILQRKHSMDILVNNSFDFSKETGFNDPSGEFMSKNQWMKSLESGIYWHALSTKFIGERMKRQQRGSIINISSMYGLVAPDPFLYEDVDSFNPPSYSTVKSGLIGLTKYTASFFGKYNVRCNALAPGSFPNIDPDAYNTPTDEKFMQKLKNKTIFGRLGVPEDLIGVLIFLASDASSYMTGQTIVVDGGWTVR